MGPWKTLGPEAAQVRQSVFVRELGIDPLVETDVLDSAAVHAVLRNALGMPVATGRLLPSLAGVARIGRMAVERPLRGAGWGRMVLDALLETARARGDRQVVLDAQANAQDFYRRAGFVVRGEPFVEAGINHVSMGRDL